MFSIPDYAATTCTSVVPSWSQVPSTSITASPLFGMSNSVFAVSVTDPSVLEEGIEPSRVILRIYPDKPSRVVNRAKEQTVFSYLSQTRKGIKMYHGAPKYRIEEFFDGKKIAVEELHNKDIMKKIARALWEYNQDKELFKIISQFDSGITFAEKVLTEWKPIITQEFETYKHAVKTEESRKILNKLKYLTTNKFEEEYKSLLHGLTKSELVASHCDLHEMNMLKSADKKRVMLIDYEYTSVNYRAMDIATLYIETSIDYTYPSFPYFKHRADLKWNHKELDFFVRSYLEQDPIFKEHITMEASRLMREVKLAEPLISALWTMWALLTADWKNYDESKNWNLKYAELRFNMYEQAKKNSYT